MLESSEVIHRRDAASGENRKLTCLGHVFEQGEVGGRVLLAVNMYRGD